MATNVEVVNQRVKGIASDGSIFFGDLDVVNQKIIKITHENGTPTGVSDVDPIKALAHGEAVTAIANAAIALFNPPPPAPPVTP